MIWPINPDYLDTLRLDLVSLIPINSDQLEEIKEFKSTELPGIFQLKNPIIKKWKERNVYVISDLNTLIRKKYYTKSTG